MVVVRGRWSRRPRPPPGEGHYFLPVHQGRKKTSPSRRWWRCRKRRQDVAPFEGLSMRFRNGTSWSGRCEVN
jgi:hypothetical protein